ncbi:sensor histidine kinase [Cohnella sp. 56]|uniref:sensor histidine kinase n=1 Tax=Cohnella sp. 56 TaxID=3113722 RepID=UPI0030EACCC7
MRYIVCLLMGLLIGCGSASSAWAKSLDARDSELWHPREDGIVYLHGPWELYWNRLLEPGDFASGSPADAMSVTVPAEWHSYKTGGHALSNEGFATYTIRFSLSNEASSQPLGLYVHNVASAYRLWINGAPAGGIGTVGTDAARMIPRSYPNVYFFVPRTGDNELVIQVSNFSQRTGGIWEGIELGDAQQIASLHRNNVLTWMFAAGSLTVMAVFSFFLYLFRKKDLAALWFGLICLAICIRSSLLGESYAYALLPWLSWDWGVKLEYWSEIVTILGIAAFVNKQYPQEAIRRVFPAFGAALAAFAAFVLVTPAKVYTLYMVPYVLLLLLPVFLYVLYVYVRAALRRRAGSRANFVGFTVFFASVIYDVLYYTGFVPFGGLVTFGLLFFLMTQLLNVSQTFTRAITQSEWLTSELRKTIESQEETIRQRTSSLQALNRKLEEGNRELSRIEEERSALLAEVRHDLMTPITSIKGFSKAIMTGVIADEAPHYASRVYERSLLLEQLIDNVVELSELKAGGAPFRFEETPLLPLLRHLCRRYEADADAAGIGLIWEEPDAWPPPDREIVVRLDPVRFERVFANLVSNAVKYTPGDGRITVWAEYGPGEHPHDDRVTVHVTDTGMGIAESELAHIFKRRYRVPDTQAGAGSGLGLAICEEIVKRHGGTIGARSRPGAGSDFFLTLPALARDAEGGQSHEHTYTAG